MKLLVDVNLSPSWAFFLECDGWEATHWTAVGDPRASDREIMAWARTNGFVVFTHDLDFGAILAVTHAQGPSVIQVRAQDVSPEHLGSLVTDALCLYQAQLETGALIVVDENRCRVKILPLML